MNQNATLPQLVGQELFDAIPQGTPLVDYLQWAMIHKGGPPMYHVATMMALACHELALRGFTLASGEPMSMWFTLIGASRTGKSSAIDMGTAFIRDVWDSAGSVPVNDPWVEASGSVAGLLSAIQEHFVPTRGTTVCMLYEREFSALFRTREAIPEFLCTLADGGTMQRNIRELQKGPRTNVRADRIYTPVVSGLFSSTEQNIASVFTEPMRHGGLYSRVWWIKPIIDPTHLRRRRPIRPQDRDPAIQAWASWIVSMGLHESRVITFSDEADAYLESVFAPVAEKYDESDDMAPTRLQAVDKAEVVAAIFATMGGRTEIQLQDVQLARAFMDILIRHSLRMQHLGSSELVLTIDRARKHIQAAGEAGLSRTDLYRKIKRDQHTLDTIVGTLLDQQAIIEDRCTPIVRYFSTKTFHAKEVARVRANRGLDPSEPQIFDLRAEKYRKR